MCPHSSVGAENTGKAARWPGLGATAAAAAWSLVYALLGLYWSLGGDGFPFGEGDPEPILSWFGSATAAVGGPVIAAASGAGVLVAAAMALPVRSAAGGRALAVAGWAAAALLLVFVPDYRVLMGLAYAPVLSAGWLLGMVPGSSVVEVFSWPVLNQLWCMSGGFAWALAALGQWRRSAGACRSCGRTEDERGWTSRASAARWGRTAVYVSVVMPVAYCLTRWAWALGLSLGVSDELTSTMPLYVRAAAAMLATMGLGGAALTFGLIRPWGEVFPRWMIGLAGRRVPIRLAVIPAALVSVLFVNAGLMYIRIFLPQLIADPSDWGASAPEFLFPLWGAALAVATLGYHLRRRGQCRDCGRGGARTEPTGATAE
ncbi:hypothetical protein [Nocardiopsis sp. CC223A]|uniref:hypothetical protein n=1 Tax=Nocardiopsis sp. CC223A TaxID=3044051 RepID=UPI00278C09DD|nr:hypothetical protein [Nocardiopsis sp. CC223A]